jgi:hypothetical protein
MDVLFSSRQAASIAGAGPETGLFINTNQKHIDCEKQEIDRPARNDRRIFQKDRQNAKYSKDDRKDQSRKQHPDSIAGLMIQIRKSFLSGNQEKINQCNDGNDGKFNQQAFVVFFQQSASEDHQTNHCNNR